MLNTTVNDQQNNETNETSKLINLKSIFLDFCVIAIATGFQSIWMSIFISTKVGLVNLLPTFIYLAIWYFFCQNQLTPKYFGRYFWISFLLGFSLSLRLPITIAPQLEFTSWIIYLGMIGLIGYKFFKYFQERKQLIVLSLAIAIVFFNTFTHLFLDSPFIYSFRIMNNVSSNYIPQKDNNSSWECSYEDKNLPVHCDMRHFIPSEKIFTEPNYDASFSVFLNRFFYGYINSLVGIQGHRFFMSVSLNIFLWISACVAIYRMGEMNNLNSKALGIAMICTCSSWGFVHFVGQPSPHLTAFAFASIILWATLELINNQTFSRPLVILLIVSGSLVYDSYPLILISSLLLIIYKQRILGILIPFLAIIFNACWKYISLQQVLGTVGNITHVSSPSSNLTYSFENWLKAILSLDFNRIWQFISSGLMAYLYGGMILGAIASTGLIIYLWIKKKDNVNSENNQLLLTISTCFCSVMLIAMFFVASQSEIWSPTKFIPRFAFYTYPINTLAIAFFVDKFITKFSNTWINNLVYLVPALTFVVANLTLIRLASIPVWFEYGLVGIYWQ
jgi:hypothetical protein